MRVIPITRGYSRDHRPDLNQVMLDLVVEQQAGIPLLMTPRSGNTSDASDFGDVVTAHIASCTRPTARRTWWQTAPSTVQRTFKNAHTGSQWITRVPATLTEAQNALELATPETMLPLMEGYRYQTLAST